MHAFVCVCKNHLAIWDVVILFGGFVILLCFVLLLSVCRLFVCFVIDCFPPILCFDFTPGCV